MEIYFILVGAARGENVGAAARAMKTMGFANMRLVASDAHQSDQARWVAHGAQEILEQAESFDSVNEAVADMDLVIATTARRRGHCQQYLNPVELCQQLRDKQQNLARVAILFGREESGLTNQELEQADLLTYLPLKVSYPSLNLGQAIMLYSYELSSLEDLEELPAEEIDSGQIHALKHKSATLLRELDFSEDEALSQWLIQKLPLLNSRELKMAHSLCNRLKEKLENS
ncbi:tRNA/rRNA methyltransferase [Dongshaea marina]|uniref:tRNA/rRNA methyltransferase n=1 Tax=Dongshaea marina TaxID=2047966 RepID=UPI000D3EC4BF|nr:tRNA/rRNA methyltransferase [Dongshaea marina]